MLVLGETAADRSELMVDLVDSAHTDVGHWFVVVIPEAFDVNEKPAVRKLNDGSQVGGDEVGVVINEGLVDVVELLVGDGELVSEPIWDGR